MAVKYLVGIDFGHGETTASCYDIYGTQGSKGVVRLNIGKGDDVQRKKPSVVYRGLRRDGSCDYRLDRGKYAPYISFKVGPSSLNDTQNEKKQNREKKEAFQNFIRLIYDRIIENNKFLTKEDTEFLLYIASPTRWDKTEKANYKRFVEEAIKRPVEWVINESDAAYFKKNEEGNESLVLVVDFGSSTIDYTLMHNKRKIDIDYLSNRLGAEQIECDLLNVYKDNPRSNYTTFKTRSENIKKEKGHFLVDIDIILKLAIRKAKEYAYSEEEGWISFQANIDSTYLETKTGNTYKNDFLDFEEEYLGGYIKSVHENFQNLKEEIYKRYPVLNTKPQQLHIILSGGASRMPWVKEKLEEVFVDTDIEEDSYPEYIVSDGIVKYAYTLWNVKTKLLEVEHEFDEWANENLKNIFEKAVSETCREVELKELQAEKSKDSTWIFTHPFAAKEPDYNINDFIDMMKKHNETIANKKKNEISNQIKDAIQPQLNKKICSSFNEKLANLLGMTMKIENLNLCPVEVNLLPETFSIAEDEQMTINRCTDALKKWWFGPKWLWANTDQTPIKPREQSARITMMEFYTESLAWKKYADLIFKNTHIDNYILQIKESAKKALIPIVADALTFNPCGYDLEKELSLNSCGNMVSENFTSLNTNVDNVFQ